ncbi:DUF4214 domain-containing protein [Massilia sp. TS11]|uniref:DUF4214 domain-containing protein n=1 Tax=Massilia sp. TS11 TaxID=2908003 RepID=UPI001EDB9F59|nr:DUF4214 domain-containing protein [Massilia sp. TS11]MCG2584103.1 DUF4214 domain-containing protein [Massilia sp. TS11]
MTLPPGYSWPVYLTGTKGDDTWQLGKPSTTTYLMGLAGNNTLDLGAIKRSDCAISPDGQGHVVVNIAGSPGLDAYYVLDHVGRIVFDNGKDSLQLESLYGDLFAPIPAMESASYGAPLGPYLYIKYSEAIYAGSGQIQLRGTDGSSQSFDVANPQQVQVLGDSIRLNVAGGLHANTNYDIELARGVVSDLAGHLNEAPNTHLQVSTALAANQAAQGNILIGGTAFEGQTLSAHLDVSDADGLGTDFVWQVDGGPAIHTSTPDLQIKLTHAMAGHAVQVGVSYVDQHGYREGFSGASAVVGGVFTADGKGNAIAAGNGNDILIGGPGNDLLIPYFGDDQVDGGPGLDTVSLGNTRDLYDIVVQNGVITTHDRVGYEGTDVLRNVERIDFFTSSLAFDIDGNGGEAYRLYHAAFDREPDLVGLGYWITRLDRGASLTAVAQAFSTSAEWQTVYGSAHNNQELVASLYQHVLHRAGDAGGISYWSQLLDSHQASLAQVLIGFSESAESKAATAPLVANGIPYISAYWF